MTLLNGFFVPHYFLRRLMRLLGYYGKKVTEEEPFKEEEASCQSHRTYFIMYLISFPARIIYNNLKI